MTLKDNKIVFITIDQRYIRSLYAACNEVYYRTSDYDNKPYLGVLINVDENNKYAIPLTSAKEKHKFLKNYDNGKLVIYEDVSPSVMSVNDIWKPNIDGTAKHILSVLNIAKMIPLKEGYYSEVNINVEVSDSIDVVRYKNLLNKELRICVSKKDKILRESEKIYTKQITTGKVYFSYCDFKKLEAARDSFI